MSKHNHLRLVGDTEPSQGETPSEVRLRISRVILEEFETNKNDLDRVSDAVISYAVNTPDAKTDVTVFVTKPPKMKDLKRISAENPSSQIMRSAEDFYDIDTYEYELSFLHEDTHIIAYVLPSRLVVIDEIFLDGSTHRLRYTPRLESVHIRDIDVDGAVTESTLNPTDEAKRLLDIVRSHV